MKEITNREDVFLGKIAGRDVDISTMTPPVANGVHEEILEEIADRIDAIESSGGGGGGGGLPEYTDNMLGAYFMLGGYPVCFSEQTVTVPDGKVYGHEDDNMALLTVNIDEETTNPIVPVVGDDVPVIFDGHEYTVTCVSDENLGGPWCLGDYNLTEYPFWIGMADAGVYVLVSAPGVHTVKVGEVKPMWVLD